MNNICDFITLSGKNDVTALLSHFRYLHYYDTKTPSVSQKISKTNEASVIAVQYFKTTKV